MHKETGKQEHLDEYKNNEYKIEDLKNEIKVFNRFLNTEMDVVSIPKEIVILYSRYSGYSIEALMKSTINNLQIRLNVHVNLLKYYLESLKKRNTHLKKTYAIIQNDINAREI